MRPAPKALFLDRDGTLIKDNPYSADPTQIELLPTVIPALHYALRLQFKLIMITNQSGIGRGLINQSQFLAFHTHLLNRFREHNITFTDMFYCPHHPTEAKKRYRVKCTCRKPEPGMLFQAINRHGLDSTECVMIGDKITDVLAGYRAGIRGALLHPTPTIDPDPQFGPLPTDAVIAPTLEAAIHQTIG